jgi:hypothetical protein
MLEPFPFLHLANCTNLRLNNYKEHKSDIQCGNNDSILGRHAGCKSCAHNRNKFLDVFASLASIVRYSYLLKKTA